ncbi:hypothetical protein AAVH_27178 [Aphelenchoides avenae]|nr:hypothetical protein AAVH_27178 [Aphelenchus avenae]
MDNHKPYSCNTFHRCPSCNCHYTVQPNRKNGGHDCNEKFCRVCFQKHRKDKGCYITLLKEKKVEPHRIIAYDAETIIRKKNKSDAVAEGEQIDVVEEEVGNTEQSAEASDEEFELSDMDEEEDEEEEHTASRRRRNSFRGHGSG